MYQYGSVSAMLSTKNGGNSAFVGAQYVNGYVLVG